MVLCQKKETEVVNFVRKDDHLVVHRAQHHMPHGGGGRRAGRVPARCSASAAPPRPRGPGAGAPTRVFRLAARADTRGVGWGDPGPGASRAGLAGGCSSRGTNPARDIGPALAPMPRPSAAASIPFGAFTAARRSRCRLRLSVSGDRGLLPAGLDR